MQYLLSESEYEALRESASAAKEQATATIQKLCTLAADNVSVEVPWNREKKSPCGCIISKRGHGYCDLCPVQDDCPYPHKQWSK